MTLGVVLAACGGPRFHLPMTAAELARSNDADALGLYLSQPGADPTVCDASAPGPHVVGDARAGRVLTDGLRARTIAPAIWRACVDHIFATAGRGPGGALLGEIVRATPPVLDDPALEWDPGARARLDALAGAYQQRPPELRVAREAADGLAAALRTRLPRLGAQGRARASELLATLDLERGRWGERVVDLAFLDDHAGDEPLLARFAARLPDAGLRRDAARRLIRLRIAASPFPELRADAAHLEELVLAIGMNPVSTRLHPPRTASLDAARLGLAGVQLEQQVERQVARLVDPRGALLGRLSLAGALAVELTGVSHPVTLCRPARELDPTPCLLPGDVEIASPLVWRDRDGGVHLVEHVAAAEVVRLAQQERLHLPIAIGGAALAAIDAPVSFTARGPLVYAASAGAGPELDVTVDQRGDRLLYTIATAHSTRVAVVSLARAAELAIVSRGAAGGDGASGTTGSSGFDGAAGSPATCPSSSGNNGGDGGDGADGGNGGDGSDGGDGGAIHVRARCPDGECRALLAVLRATLRSEGGDGGDGGRGGSGGRGGRAGASGDPTTCSDAEGHTTVLSGGLPGRDGRDGSSGHAGADGRAGAPGPITFAVEPLRD